MTAATPSSSFYDTPVEILDRILDFLHDDRTTLRSASLVSRQWVHAPRHHLFGRMSIVEMYGRGHLLEDNATSFLALAQSDHCTILAAIKSVILAITTPELVDRVVNVLALSKALSKVAYIHLSQSDSISWNASALSNVRNFAFECFYYTFNNDAWRLITSFRNLHTLSLYTPDDAIITLPPDLSISHFSHLRTLRLKLDPSKSLFEWLKSLDGTLLFLETFDLRIYCSCHSGWGSIDVLNSILKGFSNTLKNLSLGINYGFHMENQSLGDGPSLDLSSLTNLHTLFLRTHDMNAICDSLESLSSPIPLSLLTVHILRWPFDRYCHNKTCHCVLSELLTKFAGVLEGRQFMETQILELNVPAVFDFDVVVGELRKWKEKRELWVSRVDDYEAQSIH